MIKEVVISEYECDFIKDDGTVWTDTWVGTGAKVAQYNGNHQFVEGRGGLYNTILRKENGDVYVNIPQTQNLRFLQKDSAGTAFRAKAVECYMQTYFAVRDDGSIWSMGYNSYKWFGTNTGLILNEWNKIPGQPPVKFKSVYKGVQLIALTEDGAVYTLPDGSATWTKKSLPGPVRKMAVSAGNGFYVALINGAPYGWGQSRYLTGVTGNIVSYESLAEGWGLGGTIIDIAANHNTIHYITDNGELWGFGDNAQGEVGVGWEIVNRRELYKGTQYVWNWIDATQPSYQGVAFVPKPVRIKPDKLFSRVWGGGTYAFYKYARDRDGNLYRWGRNKSVVLGETAISNESAYPNALDLLSPTQFDPFAYFIPVTSLNVFVPGSVSAGNDIVASEDSVTLTGNAAPAGSPGFPYKIVTYQWTKLSGGSCVIESPGAATTRVTSLMTGVYVFELKVTDNNGATMTDTVMVTVQITNKPPVVSAGPDLILIGKSTTLAASATDSDGKIVSVSWKKISGPQGDILSNPDGFATGVTFTNQGTYSYQVVAADDKGSTAMDTITVTVVFRGENDIVIIGK